MTTTTSPTRLVAARAARLFQDHEELEVLFDDLLLRVESGDWALCDAIWGELTRRLDEHMRYEESELLPSFARSSPGAAAKAVALGDEHRQIRASLERMGIELQLHRLRDEEVRSFVARLRAHAHGENLDLYPWAAATLGDGPSPGGARDAQGDRPAESAHLERP